MNQISVKEKELIQLTNMLKYYKKPIKKHIKKQKQYTTKGNTKKALFKMKKFCYTNSTQYYHHLN